METTVPYVTFNIDRLNYDEPPSWAAPWDENDLVYGEKLENGDAAPSKPKKRSFAELGQKLA
jgi:hypothetical protein